MCIRDRGYTIMNIGMGSLLGVMATNDAERASLASARGFGSTVGGIIGMMVIPVVLQVLGETPAGYAATGVAAALTCGILVFIHYIGTVERNVAAQHAVKTAEEKEKEKVKVTDILNVFKVNRPYLALCVHSICICFVQGIAQGASTYMYADVLGAIGLSSLATVVGMPVMFGGLILAPILAKKYDFVSIIRTMILVGCIMLGGLFAYAMMVETMNAILYIVWSGIGTAQPASAIFGIKAMCILFPAVIAMGSWAAFRFIWDINKEKRAAMAAWKAERAAKAAEQQ